MTFLHPPPICNVHSITEVFTYFIQSYKEVVNISYQGEKINFTTSEINWNLLTKCSFQLLIIQKQSSNKNQSQTVNVQLKLYF